MKMKIFNIRDYGNYEKLENSVNEFLTDATLSIIDIKPIRLSNNPSIDSIMVTYMEVL